MRIVFVDDAAVSGALFVRIVRELGHDVVLVPAPREAPVALDDAPVVALARQFDPDLIIVDGRWRDPLGTDPVSTARLAATIAVLRDAVPRAIVGVVAAPTETALLRVAADAGAGFVVPRPLLRSQVATVLAALHERATAR